MGTIYSWWSEYTRQTREKDVQICPLTLFLQRNLIRSFKSPKIKFFAGPAFCHLPSNLNKRYKICMSANSSFPFFTFFAYNQLTWTARLKPEPDLCLKKCSKITWNKKKQDWQQSKTRQDKWTTSKIIKLYNAKKSTTNLVADLSPFTFFKHKKNVFCYLVFCKKYYSTAKHERGFNILPSCVRRRTAKTTVNDVGSVRERESPPKVKLLLNVIRSVITDLSGALAFNWIRACVARTPDWLNMLCKTKQKMIFAKFCRQKGLQNEWSVKCEREREWTSTKRVTVQPCYCTHSWASHPSQHLTRWWGV